MGVSCLLRASHHLLIIFELHHSQRFAIRTSYVLFMVLISILMVRAGARGVAKQLLH